MKRGFYSVVTYLATFVRRPEDEAKESVVKWDVLEWGGHWKVRLFGTFWGGNRPPLLPQVSDILIPQ